MSLFKALAGDSSRISTDITPFHEGYVYLTTDDGGFYVDAVTANGNERIRINPGDRCEDCVLAASGWQSNSQTVSVPGLKANHNGIAGLSQTIQYDVYQAAKMASLRVTGQVDGNLTITADGTVPTVDIPIVVIMRG